MKRETYEAILSNDNFMICTGHHVLLG